MNLDMHFTLGNIISLASMIIGGFIGFWKMNAAITSSVNSGIKEVEDKFEKALHDHVKEEDEKRRRTYERIDEIKKFADERFVTKDIINVMHEGTARNLGALERKLDDLKIDFRSDLSMITKSQNDLREAILKVTIIKSNGITL